MLLENASDRKIWEFAKKEGFTIVTFDADFYDLVTLFGHPPKIARKRQHTKYQMYTKTF